MPKKFALPKLRRLPVLLLLAALLGIHSLESTPLLSLRQTLFDSYQRWQPRDRSAIPAVVVEIDEKSLRQEGQWPWPRNRVAALMDRITAGEPLVVGLDIAFPEPDHLGPTALKQRYPGISGPLLQALPDPDAALAKALTGKPVVLGLFGTPEPSATNQALPHPITLQSRGASRGAPLAEYPGSLPNLPILAQAAAGQGLLNTAPDPTRYGQERGVVRRVPLLAQVAQQPVATLGLEMLRVALGDAPIQTESSRGEGVHRVQVGDYALPTQAQGNLLLHFGPWQQDRYLSAADLLSGQQDPSILKGRFVIVGFTGLGLTDQALTPLGEKVPGVDIHAQVVESLLAGVAVQRPHWMDALEAALLLVLGLMLMVAVPRLKPRHTAGLGAGLLLALVLVGGGLFSLSRWLFDGLSIAVLLTPLFVVLLRDALVALDRQRQQAEKALQASREAAAKVAGELGAARRIQLGLVPDPVERFAKEKRFELAALLEPAREIGGDYYDCFMLDERRLCLSIGDVTGKGVPASLFMAISKTLCGTMSRQTNGDPGLALQGVAEELNRENPHYLFVTTVLAVLDVETGIITYACAGHEPPILRRGEATLRLEVEAISGPPLCAMRDYPFGTAQAQLQPGDLVCLFTDGINEATDGQHFYGTERVVALMAQMPSGTSSQACLDAIYADTEKFMAGHPPADDRTLLVFRWWGAAGAGASA